MAMACRQRYRTGANFLSTFNPSCQYRYIANLEDCYLGHAPELTVAAQAFGENVAQTWLSIQLRDLSEFSGCRDKVSTAQLNSLANVIRWTFGYLRVTELMHFFVLFKSGQYGHFYGAVDPLVITEALREYLSDRMDTLMRLERERERREAGEAERLHAQSVAEFHERLRRQGITLQEWLEQLQ